MSEKALQWVEAFIKFNAYDFAQMYSPDLEDLLGQLTIENFTLDEILFIYQYLLPNLDYAEHAYYLLTYLASDFWPEHDTNEWIFPPTRLLIPWLYRDNRNFFTLAAQFILKNKHFLEIPDYPDEVEELYNSMPPARKKIWDVIERKVLQKILEVNLY